ncbi:hypothetical protein CONCODRAFT_12329 [Conidiobolus coronatus NRRL 28638]|uniref:Uncharacterized protein n=1 Tax=Conidiobolus coronatus (strain ATCC 28846 / CBS 209.66 / NRRL 28638) TaxID=796925 RepID=A0A137NT53_CONC2|nr:hypothetical protein CONCODRAFT_12329 [Conidiobolus coronatus NRRL 28638]|eukprot:KXN65943.1 hypothetical protein CONCODRAFT_12329 [Conidiobolus coronatus NRRL 28638]
MQLIILTTLISFLVANPSFDWGKFDPHGDVAGNAINGALHTQSNKCYNNVENIGGGFTAFDNSCHNFAGEFDTDDHSNSKNGWKEWKAWPLNGIIE